MLRSIYLVSFLLLQSLFAFAGNVKENGPSSFDLYVCIGQSNMAGRATLTPEVMDLSLIHISETHRNIWSWDPYTACVPAAQQGWFVNPSEVKPVFNRRCLLYTSHEIFEKVSRRW